MRTFEVTKAVRESVPLLIGQVGPSGSGKTYSALVLAKGICNVKGGKTYLIDTESRRASLYAESFDFYHLDFKPPFGSLDYSEAIKFCVSRGDCSCLIVDSMSHEHEGSGGCLELHESELTRLSKGDDSKRDKLTFLAWAKPKANRRKLMDTIVQLNTTVIMNFRAKEKIKLVTGKPPVDLGWQPIGAEEFVYEMTFRLFLPAFSNGTPMLISDNPAEREITKLPGDIGKVLGYKDGKIGQITVKMGEDLAKWSSGIKNQSIEEFITLLAEKSISMSLENKLETNVNFKMLTAVKREKNPFSGFNSPDEFAAHPHKETIAKLLGWNK